MALDIGRGRENMFSHEQNLRCTERWVEKLVGQGKLPASALEAIIKKQRDDYIPTTTINSRPVSEMVPQYVKGRIPGRSCLSRLLPFDFANRVHFTAPHASLLSMLMMACIMLLQLHVEQSTISRTSAPLCHHFLWAAAGKPLLSALECGKPV